MVWYDEVENDVMILVGEGDNGRRLCFYFFLFPFFFVKSFPLLSFSFIFLCLSHFLLHFYLTPFSLFQCFPII